jgi:hypothetical protein
MIPAEFLTKEYIVVIIVFILALFILYRLFKVVMKSMMVMAAAFAFPFLVSYLNLPLPISPDLDTAFRFALLGLLIFVVYEFFGFITHFFRLLTFPFRRHRR